MDISPHTAWEVFTETGDPVSYLLYKSVLPEQKNQKEDTVEAKIEMPSAT